VIGDTVNLASRLEGTAKYYGINYLVGEHTRMLAPDACPYRELDKIRVVGKHLPVTIYEPQVGPGALSSAQLERFHAGLQHNRQREWAAAQAEFSALLVELPDDKPSQLYVGRCDYFIAQPPADDWDGVFNRAEK
jgi:adenylate cyclase